MPRRDDLPPDSESDDDLPLSVRKKRPAVGEENQASPAKRIRLEKAAGRDRSEPGPGTVRVSLPDEVPLPSVQHDHLTTSKPKN